MKTFEKLVQLSKDNAERRKELLESICNIHGKQAAAVAMAVAEFHVLLSITERLVMATPSDNPLNTEGMRKMLCMLMRNGVLERTILPLLHTTSVPDDDLEDYSKITQQLVETLEAGLDQI